VPRSGGEERPEHLPEESAVSEFYAHMKVMVRSEGHADLKERSTNSYIWNVEQSRYECQKIEKNIIGRSGKIILIARLSRTA